MFSVPPNTASGFLIEFCCLDLGKIVKVMTSCYGFPWEDLSVVS